MKYPNFIQFTISDDSRSIFHNQQRKFRLLIRDKTVSIFVSRISKINVQPEKFASVKTAVAEFRGQFIDDLKFHVSSPVPYFPRKKIRRDRSFHD